MNLLVRYSSRFVVPMLLVLLISAIPALAAKRNCKDDLSAKYTPEKIEEVAKYLNYWVKASRGLFPRSKNYKGHDVTAHEYTLRSDAYQLRQLPQFREQLTAAVKRHFAEWDAIDAQNSLIAQVAKAELKARAKASENKVQFEPFTVRYFPKLDATLQEKQDLRDALINHLEMTARFPSNEKPEEAELADKLRGFANDGAFLALLPGDLAVRVPQLIRLRQ